MDSKLKTSLANHTGELISALLLLQPLLDVLSYFMKGLGATSVTTALRTVMLFVVCAYGFIVSGRKRVYYIAYGIIGAFWAAHMLNCWRIGYHDPLADAGEYLKLVQLPLWSIAFVSFFRAGGRAANMYTAGLLACNFLLVLVIIGLSFATGRPEYTYAGIKVGLLGWFAVPTAQSAIVSMLCLGLLLWAYRTDNLWVFTAAAVLGLGLLYLTATRLTYFSAILITAGMLGLIVLACLGREGGKSRWLSVIPLAAALVLLVLFRGSSPMQQRRAAANDSYERYQARTDQIMGADRDFVYDGGGLTPELEKKIRRVYEEVYRDSDATGQPLLGDMLDRFGAERVMAAYGYTTRAETLYHTRTRKLLFLRLIWEDQDALTHILGFEYSNALVGDNIYDPENDFPALLYYYGWLGAGLYCGFAGVLILLVAAGALRDIRRLPGYLTVELGAYSMIFVLGLGAAQFSGNVMRRPSVTVYMSLAAAQMYFLSQGGGDGRLFARFQRRPEVTLKKL